LYCFVRKSLLDEHGSFCLQLVADGAMGTLLDRQTPIKLKKSTSFVSHMKKDFGHIQVQHCLDHVLDLVNKQADKTLPSSQ
jgi:hypothetical protein